MISRFANYSLDMLFDNAEEAERTAASARADNRANARAAGEYYFEAYTRMGAAAFWDRVRLNGKREDVVRGLMKKAGWADPNPPPPKDPSDLVLRYVQGNWPRMSHAGQERFLSWLGRTVNADDRRPA